MFKKSALIFFLIFIFNLLIVICLPFRSSEGAKGGHFSFTQVHAQQLGVGVAQYLNVSEKVETGDIISIEGGCVLHLIPGDAVNVGELKNLGRGLNE